MFGQTSGFGSGGGFGQQQQGQQTGGTGLFGQTSTGFGQPQQQQSGGLFGQTQQPAQSGGMFGQPAQQQSTGLFGSNATQGNAFGAGSTGGAFGGASTGSTFGQQPARQGFGTFGSTNTSSTPAFGSANNAAGGSTGGLFGSTSTGFGAKPATTGFGAPNTGSTGGLFGKPAGSGGMFGGQAAVAGPVTTGTSNPPYQPVKEKDGNTNNYSVYQTITCMDAYKGSSLEELRLQDYQQNRKTAPAPGTTGFGAGATTGGMFGQAAQPAAGSSGGLFGQSQPASTGFGSSGSTGLFGQQPQATGTTGFGQQQSGFGSGGGLFGSSNTNTSTNSGTGLFGGQQQQQPQQTGGLFGQQPQQQQSGGLFGQAGSTGTTGGLFGSNNNTNNTTGGGLFGQQNNQTQQPASTGFSFGANTQNQAPKPAFGGFGSGSTTSTFGQTPAAGASTGFGFGQNTNQQAQQPAQQPTSTFGFGAQPAAGGQTGGLFGSTQNQQPAQQPATGGLFGAKPAGGLFGSGSTNTGTTFGAPAQTQAQPSGGLFGNTQQTQPAGQQSGGGLFGNTGATNTFGANKPAGGLFGQPAQTGTTGGLFGNTTGQSTFGQPAGQNNTSTFGAGAQTGTGTTGGGLFGNLGAGQQGQQGQTGQPGGLFGAKPATTGTGLFGSTTGGSTLGGAPSGGTGLFGSTLGAGNQQQNNQTGLGGSLFGNSSTNQMQQSQNQAPVNIDVNNPYGSGGMFSVPPSFQPINVSTGPKILPPLSSSLRPAPSPGKITPRFRGISTPARAASTLPQSSSVLGLSTASNGSSPARNLFSTPPPDTLSPAAFTPRQGVKKLILNKKTDSLALSSEVANRTPRISRSILNPEAENDATSINGSAITGLNGSMAPASRQASVARTMNGDVEKDTVTGGADFSRRIDLDDYSHGEYYTIPEESELYNASDDSLRHVEDFVVGRKGYGRLTYLEPVDLGDKDNIKRIAGGLVVFDDGKCEVYPNEEDNRPPGEGLNHRAEISLEDCWPRNKETQQPITDPKHPKQRSRERNLRHVPDTTFQSYDPVTGVWVFTVEHFTLYGIPEEDDSDDETEPLKLAVHDEDIYNINGKRARSDDLLDVEEDMESVHTSPSHESILSPSSAEHYVASSSEGSIHEKDWQSDLAFAPVPLEERNRDLIFEGMYGTPQPESVTSTPRPNKKRLQFFRKAEKDQDGEVDDMSIDRSFFGAATTAPSDGKEWKMKKIATKDSVTCGNEGAYLDLGLALGRSYRVGFGPLGQLFRPDVTDVYMQAGARNSETDRAIIVKLLDFQLKHSSIYLENGIPMAETSTTVQFKDFTDLYRGDLAYEAELWRLGQALFDKIDTSVNEEIEGEIRVDAQSLVRKTMVSDWLTDHLASLLDRQITDKSSGPHAVYCLLAANQVNQAVTTCIASGDLRLSTLVAQAGSGPDFKNVLALQIDSWRKQGADAHMDLSYRKIHALLAGVVDVLDGSSKASDTDMTQGLSWLQAFGLHLWYGTALEQPLPDVIHHFQAHLDSDHPPRSPTIGNQGATDAMYNMLRVFVGQASPSSCLSDSACFGRSPMDARLQWHLLDLLINVYGLGIDENDILESVRVFDRVTLDYASQLESNGYWVFAIFVYLHLDVEVSRAKAVKEILGRHAAEIQEHADLLQNTLLIPSTWIAEAMANLRRSQGAVYDEFVVCKTGGLLERAHRLVITQLAPEVILRDDMALLKRLLNGLDPVSVFAKGGQVLLHYADLTESASTLLGMTSEELQSQPVMLANMSRIPELLEDMERLYPSSDARNLQQVACRAHMICRVQKLASALASRKLMHMPPLSRFLTEGDRLQVMQSASRDRLTRRLEALPA